MDAVILAVQALLVGLVLYVLTRVNQVEKTVADLRVEVAELKGDIKTAVQRLDDHISQVHH